jgi:hypothetical protein
VTITGGAVKTSVSVRMSVSSLVTVCGGAVTVLGGAVIV